MQMPHAVGTAMAAKYKRDNAVVTCYFSDGGTSKGDFHEGFNMAGVYKLPVVLSVRITTGRYQFREKDRPPQRHWLRRPLPMGKLLEQKIKSLLPFRPRSIPHDLDTP